jgi:predicted HTH transcriptional regulator
MTSWIEIEHIDALPVRGPTLADLDLGRVERHVQTARSTVAADALSYLQQQRGVIAVDGELVPTLGGLLCFGREPQRWLPQTGIALTRYAGTTANSNQVLDIRDLRGSLFDLIDQAEAYLWAQSNHGFRLESGPRRIPLDQYPRTAIRELVVNAVAHRDYRVAGSRVKIEMFRNQIEWTSPGGLPPGITVENILKSQYTRNPVLVHFLFDAGYIEQRGMGLDTVVNSLAEEQLPYPTMEDAGSSFLIRIEGHGAVDRHAAMGLSAPVAQLYTLIESAGGAGISARSMAERLGMPVRTVNHRLKELLERRLVQRVGATTMTRYLINENDM